MLRRTDVPLHLECQWPQGWLTTYVKSIQEGTIRMAWVVNQFLNKDENMYKMHV